MSEFYKVGRIKILVVKKLSVVRSVFPSNTGKIVIGTILIVNNFTTYIIKAMEILDFGSILHFIHVTIVFNNSLISRMYLIITDF